MFEKRELSPNVTLYCADCRDLLPVECDAVIADPPFSERTHSGHDASANGHIGEMKDGSERKELGYSFWGNSEIVDVVSRMPKKGWVCIFTDHTLAPVWSAQMADVGRYVFAPIPVVTPGRSVRLSGDGPSSWTDWLIVSRTTKECRWGTLPGFYLGHIQNRTHMGAKPVNVMRDIVEHYTKEGDTVCDFCMGSGTTGIACIGTGRKFIGIEKNKAYFDLACERLTNAVAQTNLFDGAAL